MPWLLNLVLAFTIVIETVGSVTGLVVLMNLFLLSCACTSFLEKVAQHTTFHDVDTWSGLFWFVKSTAISVMVVPIATGTLF